MKAKATIHTQKTIVLELSEREAIDLLNVFNKIQSCETAEMLDQKEEWSQEDYEAAGKIGYTVAMTLLTIGIRSDKQRPPQHN